MFIIASFLQNKTGYVNCFIDWAYKGYEVKISETIMFKYEIPLIVELMTETKKWVNFRFFVFISFEMSDEDKQFIENIIRMNLLAFSSIIPDFEVIYLSHGIHQYLGVLQDIYTDDIDIQERTKSLPENSDTFYKDQIDGK